MMPLLQSLALAAAMALLTSHLIYSPILRQMRAVLRQQPLATPARRCLFDNRCRRRLFNAINLLLGATITSIADGYGMILGITRDVETFARIERGIAGQVDAIHELYPQLQLNEMNVAQHIIDALGQAQAVGVSVLDFMRTGSGFIAQIIIGILLFNLAVCEGPGLARQLLRYSPLNARQQRQLRQIHRTMVERLHYWHLWYSDH